MAVVGPVGAALIAVAAALPILAIEVVPLFDYANHLSRAHVIAHWDRSPTFQTWFEPSSFLIPNVLADLILVGLTRVVGAETAGRLLLLLIGGLTLGGTVALARVRTGRFEPWPLFSAVFLYNEMFLWGFLNYTLGLAILLWALALWLYLGQRSRRLQLAGGAIFALLAFFAHLVAFGLFAIAIAVLELQEAWRYGKDRPWAAVRRLAGSSGVFVPPLILFYRVSPSSDLPIDLRFDFSPFAKLSPLTRVLASGNTLADMAVLLGTLALLGGLVAARRVSIDRPLAGIAAAYLLALLALPYSALHSFFVDARVAIAVVLLFIPAIRSRDGGPGLLAAGLGGLLLITTIRTAALLQDWSVWQEEYRRITGAMDRLPQGSVLIAASAKPFEYAADWVRTRTVHPPHEHTASYATIRRDVIVPSIFAKRGQNPLVFTPPSKTLKAISLGPIFRADRPQRARELAYRAAIVRAELDRHGLIDTPLFVIVFGLDCVGWPEGLPLIPTHCSEEFSIMETQRLDLSTLALLLPPP